MPLSEQEKEAIISKMDPKRLIVFTDPSYLQGDNPSVVGFLMTLDQIIEMKR